MDQQEHFSFTITKETRKDSKSRYKTTIPLLLMETAIKDGRVDFNGFIYSESGKFKIKLYTKESKEVHEYVKQIVSMIEDVLKHENLRESYAEKFKEFVLMDLFPEQDELDELLTILSSIDLPPPNHVSRKNLEYIRDEFLKLLVPLK